MQIYARDNLKQLFHARNALKQTDYFCVECHQSVRLRGGPQRQAHFYHLDPTPFCRQHQKGMIHLQLQSYFFNRLPTGDCQLEHHFPEINRIADVAWFSEKIVFEIQYSAISSKEVLERNRDYKSCGWQVVWILHDHRFNQNRLSAAESALENFPHYFTNMDQFGKGVIYDQFDVREENFRKNRFPPLPIEIRTIFYPEQIQVKKNHLNVVQKRLIHWSIAFKGDLLNLSQENMFSEYIKKAFDLEELQRSKMEKLNKRSFFIVLQQKIVNLYFIFFRYLLEKSCR